jgi:pantetheine-phosphate adenylyltransferase
LNTAPQLAALLRETMPVHHFRDATVLDDVAARWFERQRVWHGPHHLGDMIHELGSMPATDERETLLLAAAYHDVIYDPRASDNEEASATLLRGHAGDAGVAVIRQAAELIVASKWSGPPRSALEERFFALDTYQLSDACPLHKRSEYEAAIFREYQWADSNTYREKRSAFLHQWKLMFPQHSRGVDECLELLAAFHPRIGIYPGSFAPFHLGHLSILRQAEALFDKVIIAVGNNRQKAGSVESEQTRLAELQGQLCFHDVQSFPGLLTDYLDSLAPGATIVRGVRDGTDLEAELRYSRFLNELRPGTRVVWISCEAELQHLSSSAIRELESIQPEAGRRYIPGTSAIYELVDNACLSESLLAPLHWRAPASS